MKSLDDVIKALEMCTADNCVCLNGCPYSDLVKGDDCCDIHAIPEMQKDALHYLKEYRAILPLMPSLINTAIAVQKKGKTIG